MSMPATRSVLPSLVSTCSEGGAVAVLGRSARSLARGITRSEGRFFCGMTKTGFTLGGCVPVLSSGGAGCASIAVGVRSGEVPTLRGRAKGAKAYVVATAARMLWKLRGYKPDGRVCFHFTRDRSRHNTFYKGGARLVSL